MTITTVTQSQTGTQEPILSPNHYSELHEQSGITDDVIKARGAYTETSPARLRALGFADYQALAPALVLPIHSLNGWPATYYIKPDRPRTPDGKQKPLKYEYPRGAPNRLDVPAATAAVANDPGVPVLITEGIKKVDSATSAGYHCIGLGGVWNWLGRHDTPGSMPIPDFGYFVWKGRTVAIVFDSDVATNRNVRDARRRLALFLESLGARVVFIDLPPAPDGAKVGLDDHLVAQPDADLWSMAYDPVDERFAALQRKLDDMQAELDTHRDEYRWQRDLDTVDNKALSPADKLVLRDIRRVTRLAGAAAYRDPQTLFYGERLKHTGQSAKGYGGAVRRAAAMGAVELVKGTYEDSGRPKVSVVLRDAFDKPATLARPDPRKSGGPRPVNVLPCEKCGPDAGVIGRKNTVYSCGGCKDVLRTVNQPSTELVRSTVHPADCYPARTESGTGAKLHRTSTDAAPDTETPAESATGAILHRMVYGNDLLTQPYPVQCKIAPVAVPPHEPATTTALAGIYERAALNTPGLDAPTCHGTTGGCSQPGHCARQGRCPWASTVPTTTTSNQPGGGL